MNFPVLASLRLIRSKRSLVPVPGSTVKVKVRYDFGDPCFGGCSGGRNVGTYSTTFIFDG